MPLARVCNTLDTSKIIKQIREKKNFSQVKLAGKLNLSGQAISAYEAGRISPSLDIFLKILNVGGYSLTLIEDIYKTPKELSIPASEE
jgi:transcriptional regulator with XRE-family HTH domain